jgi:5'-deoxynucleotidase YfbR-like HD superfamily hydrolase
MSSLSAPRNAPFAAAFRDMSYVPRWGILRSIRKQSVAEHSYYVALYADQLATLIQWEGDTAALLQYALLHDIDETITGDIPGPVKRAAFDKTKMWDKIRDTMARRFGAINVFRLNNPLPEIKAIVAVADSIDEISYLIEETILGNKWVKVVLSEAIRRFESRWEMLPINDEEESESLKVIVLGILATHRSDPILLKDVL